MTMTHHTPQPRRRRHAWPICARTGKRRLGERKDVKLVLQDARHTRAHAQLRDSTSAWTVVRGYRCEHCSGWHLTSQPART
ncbi:hypothetical protein [Mycolicibacterium rutilum]|uniref:hypothetical protein n=1 Tax=Mycolicibacterium rutilum TaxID=370526 RepID=UPI0009F2B386|nr:hypothetical protein [Mycolicibacterium rutilum]